MTQRRFSSFRDAIAEVQRGKDRHALRNFNFMNSGQPPSVGDLLRKLGFGVEFEDLSHDVSGYLDTCLFSRRGYKIVINENHPRTRQRWTALHELAHYYLHPSYTDPLADPAMRASLDGDSHFYASEAELIEEREANEWVEAIVFEQRALDAALSLHQNNRIMIARTFGVSEQALNVVLKKRGMKK